MRLGMSLARGDFVIIQDADLELDPSEVARILAPLLSGEAEVVYGSRFMRERRTYPFAAASRTAF